MALPNVGQCLVDQQGRSVPNYKVFLPSYQWE